LNFNPLNYFIKRYYSSNLTSRELKRMLNLWLPFIFNRIKILEISNDFRNITVRLKNTIWNRTPSKDLWGGAIFSAADPFYPIMLKQNALLKDIKTDFFTKSTKVQYIKQAKTDLIFLFHLSSDEIDNFLYLLKKDSKYQGVHTVYGIDKYGNKCIKVKIQPYLRIRK